MNRQQLAIGWTGFLGMLCLVLDTKTGFESAAQGLSLCFQTLIPSLFPFFVFSTFLTEAVQGNPIAVLRPVGRLFHIPYGGESLLISAFLGGYPVGAKSVADAYSTGSVSKRGAERLLAYCSNAGPSFLFGIAASMFPQWWYPWILWGIHIVSAWMVSCLFPPEDHDTMERSTISISLSEMMTGALKAMASVCGWVIVFKIITGFLERWFLWMLPTILQILILGFLELANGCCSLYLIDDPQLRFVICSGMLAFGGVCVTMQTVSTVKKLSVHNYLLGKILHLGFSLLLSALYIQNLTLVGLFIIPVLAPVFYQKKKSSRNLRKAVV